MPNNSRLVYSTDRGRIKPANAEDEATPEGDGIARLRWETKGRKGKGVTVITGLALDHDALKDLAKQLKQYCGTGGSVKNGSIEIQGDNGTRTGTPIFWHLPEDSDYS